MSKTGVSTNSTIGAHATCAPRYTTPPVREVAGLEPAPHRSHGTQESNPAKSRLWRPLHPMVCSAWAWPLVGHAIDRMPGRLHAWAPIKPAAPRLAPLLPMASSDNPAKGVPPDARNRLRRQNQRHVRESAGALHGTPPRTRTVTDRCLKPVPLPIGLEGCEWGSPVRSTGQDRKPVAALQTLRNAAVDLAGE